MAIKSTERYNPLCKISENITFYNLNDFSNLPPKNSATYIIALHNIFPRCLTTVTAYKTFTFTTFANVPSYIAVDK